MGHKNKDEKANTTGQHIASQTNVRNVKTHTSHVFFISMGPFLCAYVSHFFVNTLNFTLGTGTLGLLSAH